LAGVPLRQIPAMNATHLAAKSSESCAKLPHEDRKRVLQLRSAKAMYSGVFMRAVAGLAPRILWCEAVLSESKR
jgi:hypothetical protein